MRYYCFCIIFLSLLLTSCKDEETTSIKYLSGDAEGRVELFYSSDNDYTEDPSNVVVTIDGTTRRAVTDERGNWKIENISTGIYNFRFEKQGYGYMRTMNFQFLGGGAIYIPTVKMYKTDSNFTVIQKAELDSTFSRILLTIITKPFQKYRPSLRGLIFAFDSDSILLATSPEYSLINIRWGISISEKFDSTPDTEYVSLFFNVFDQASIKRLLEKGKLYCAVGIAPNYNYFDQYFFDPIVSRNIYTADGPYSNVWRIKQ